MKKEYNSPNVTMFQAEPSKCILGSDLRAIFATDPLHSPDLSLSKPFEGTSEEDFWK